MIRINAYNYQGRPFILKGYVYYDDNTPVSGALVILEMVLYDREKEDSDNCSLYCGYCVTNCYGQFFFKINDKNHYYKLIIYEDNSLKEKTVN